MSGLFSAEQLSPVQQEAQTKIDAMLNEMLNDPKSPYWRTSSPRHREGVAFVWEQSRVRYGGHPAQPGDGDSAPVDIHDLRRTVGVDVTLPTNVQHDWLTRAESDVLTWAVRAGVPDPVMQRVIDFYIDRTDVSGGFDEAAIEEFRREASGWVLLERQVQTLVKWERAWSGRE